MSSAPFSNVLPGSCNTFDMFLCHEVRFSSPGVATQSLANQLPSVKDSETENQSGSKALPW